jgi:hypothetical protein
VASGDHRVAVWDPLAHQLGATLLPLNDGAALAFSPHGHYRGSPGLEKELVYIVRTHHGQETLTPEEFSQRYGWKNDPQKAAEGNDD